MGDEVSKGCLAALRAASEVIGEKCKFVPLSPAKERNKCWDVMDAITAIVTKLVVVDTLKLSVEDHGLEVTKMQPENKEFTCFGIGKIYIGPDTYITEPYQIKSETDFEFVRRELKRAIDVQKENLIKEVNILLGGTGLKISDFNVGDIRFERFTETGFLEGEIRYDITAKVK